MGASSLEERVVELESRHMHLESMLDKLNEVVIEQQGMIERLQREIAQLRELASATGDVETDDPLPPHY